MLQIQKKKKGKKTSGCFSRLCRVFYTCEAIYLGSADGFVVFTMQRRWSRELYYYLRETMRVGRTVGVSVKKKEEKQKNYVIEEANWSGDGGEKWDVATRCRHPVPNCFFFLFCWIGRPGSRTGSSSTTTRMLLVVSRKIVMIADDPATTSAVAQKCPSIRLRRWAE